jgi:oxygen-independent coproporphyrinogen-3 oxidase
MAGLYLHIPFCAQACHYCDFHFSTSLQYRSRLIEAMVMEVGLRKDYLKGEPIDTIYFGGGTPSLLTIQELKSLMNCLYANHVVSERPEVTLEANPDDLDREKLSGLRRLGINRLSIGIQSFDDDVLRFLNRAHDSSQALTAIDLARQTGFENISIDLIYAIPGQSQEQWRKNLSRALALAPEHLSTYSLTIEEKTAFGRWQKQGKIKSTGEELAAEEFELLMDMTRQAGYEHYEISNFCKPGYYSRHNSSYWKQKNYLGIGPSAHSYNGLSRQMNISHNARYEREIRSGVVPSEIETLTQENKINEYIFTTLRTCWGCDLQVLKQNYRFDLRETSREYLSGLIHQGRVVIENDILLLTQTGKLLADQIASDLFVVEKAVS